MTIRTIGLAVLGTLFAIVAVAAAIVFSVFPRPT